MLSNDPNNSMNMSYDDIDETQCMNTSIVENEENNENIINNDIKEENDKTKNNKEYDSMLLLGASLWNKPLFLFSSLKSNWWRALNIL